MNRIDPDGTDWFDNTNNFVCGMGDGLSCGATKWVRGKMGTETYVNTNSGCYVGGEVAGVGVSLLDGGTGVVGAVKAIRAAGSIKGAIAVSLGSARIVQSGGMSVAQFMAAERWATEAYETIRNTDDVAQIAKNTGWSASRISRIKQHLFFAEHLRDGRIARFDPYAPIAKAWQRMEAGTQTAVDMKLLMHEYVESRVMGIFKSTYESAHTATEARFPAGLPKE